MDTFFNPNGVAVIGAGKQNLGYFVVKNLVNGYDGPTYPVNPNYDEIEGLKCYPSVTAVSGPVELAVVLVPARIVPAVVAACAEKGIRHVIIESAGFSETGKEGEALQKQCTDIATQQGIRLWGPNCMGLVDVVRGNYFTFMHPRIRAEGILPGKISLIVQSGMMSAIFLAELSRRGIGVAKACSVGNRADVDECDLLEYLENDPDTKVIALYLESIPRGRLFARLAENSEKPVILLRGGKSRSGARAAVSHTASLSGNSRLIDSVLALSGVIPAESPFQMMDMANTLVMMEKPDPRCRTAILTLSGGAGILACDALEKNSIPLAQLSERTREELSTIFPEWMPVFNPIDLFPAVSLHGREKTFTKALGSVLKDPAVDCVLIHFVAGLEAEAPDLWEVKRLADQNGKMVVFWLMGIREGTAAFREQADKAGILVQEDAGRIAECIRAISHAAKRGVGKNRQAPDAGSPEVGFPGISWPEDIRPQGLADEYDAKRILAAWKIPVTEERIVTSREEARAFAETIGAPVVLKGLVKGLFHKTEHGLVITGIRDAAGMDEAFDQMSEKTGPGGRILAARQVAFEYELIAGFLRDEQFGPCVMFGIGGILAELEPDVVFGLAPPSTARAVDMINAIRGQRLLNGFRGMPPLDRTAMADILVRLGHLGDGHEEIAQIDINPLAICGGKPVAIDAGIVFRDER